MVEEGLLYTVQQLAGETVFVPHDWFQISWSEADTDSVSVSQEMCPWRHTDMRMLPLPLSIYGGADAHRNQAGHKSNDYHDFFAKVDFIEKPDKNVLPTFESYNAGGP